MSIHYTGLVKVSGLVKHGQLPPESDILLPNAADLDAFYELNSNTGSVIVDSSPNNINGTTSGSLVSARYDNGIEMLQNQNLSSSATIVDKTLSTWLFIDSGATSTNAFLEIGVGGTDYALSIEGGNGQMRMFHSGFLMDDPFYASHFDKWTNVILQNYSGDAKMWIDGSEVWSSTTPFGDSSTFNYNIVVSPMNAIVDNTRIFNKKLTQGEVDDLAGE